LTSGDDSMRVTLDDPAWPASYGVTAQERALLEICGEPCLVSNLIRSGKIADSSELQKYLEEGLLVTCCEWKH